MNNITPAKFIFAVLAFAASTFLATGFAHIVLQYGLTSPDASSWVQAIGATIGIGIAIWVPYRQREDASHIAETQQQETKRRVCLSIMDELTMLRKSFESDIYIDMLTSNPNESFTYRSPSREYLFPVYKAMAAQLIQIDSSLTRQAVIEAYASHSDLFDLLEINDRVLDQSWNHYQYQVEETNRSGKANYSLLKITYKGRLLGLRANIHESSTLLANRVDHAIKMLKNEAAGLAES